MARPPAHHYHPLVRDTAKALRQRCDVPPGASIVIACSGGADSVALLRACALLASRRKWRLKLIVGHIQHHLREEAEGDAAFVQHLAGHLGLPFARRDIHPVDAPGNLEANARDQRYEALADIAHEHNATFIATAHHADDQLETLLMRMLRGTSVAGLRGIAWKKRLEKGLEKGDRLEKGDKYIFNQERSTSAEKGTYPLFLIRPMLAVDQRDILGLLHQLDQPWREDATNGDTSRTRAKLRHEVLPLLKELQPDSTNKAIELAEHFGDLHALVQQSADDALPSGGASCGTVLSRDQARTMNRAVLSELLRRALIDAGVSADRLSRHALLPAVHAAQDRTGGERSFAFAKGVTLIITRQSLSIQTK